MKGIGVGRGYTWNKASMSSYIMKLGDETWFLDSKAHTLCNRCDLRTPSITIPYFLVSSKWREAVIFENHLLWGTLLVFCIFVNPLERGQVLGKEIESVCFPFGPYSVIAQAPLSTDRMVRIHAMLPLVCSRRLIPPEEASALLLIRVV